MPDDVGVRRMRGAAHSTAATCVRIRRVRCRSVAATAAATPAAATAFLRTGFVYHQVAAIDALAAERGDGRLRFLICAHLDEAEAFGVSRFAVVDHLRRYYLAVRGERSFQVILANIVA